MTIVECVFIGNKGGNGGGDALQSSPAGSGGSGGAVFAEGLLTVIDCLFVNNVAGNSGVYGNCSRPGGSGGGISTSNPESRVVTSTFFQNRKGIGTHPGETTAAGSGLFTTVSIPVANCIFWDNFEDQIDGPAIVLHSDIQDWPDPGVAGNISDDPLFVDPDNGDLRLSQSSPCINAGDPNFDPGLDLTDLDGRPRMHCDRVDMGAYEFVGDFGDFQDDQTIDLLDFYLFDVCNAGPDQPPISEDCDVFDFDCDGDVDLLDYGKFQLFYDTPNP